jgi:hypothetical protein
MKTNQEQINSANFNAVKSTGTGAGRGLVSMADQFAAAGGSIVEKISTGAGHALGVEAMALADALASREPATTPLLAACQQLQDKAIIERSAYKLRARMLADGRQVPSDAFTEAMQAAAAAVVMWRQGVSTIRTEDGGESVTLHEGAIERHVARVAWRALVSFLSQDHIGNSIQLTGGAEDDWLCAQMLPGESRRERAARLWIERHARARQSLLVRRLSNVTAGRGRRAQAAQKAANALGLMLGGDSLDDAAQAAGFNPRGRHRAGDALLQALRRLGLVSDGFSIKRRSR